MGLSEEVQSWSFLFDGHKAADSQIYYGAGRKWQELAKLKSLQPWFSY